MVEAGADGIKVVISDNGKGFESEPAMKRSDRHGIGLSIMQERAESMGGEMEISSKPNKGTTIKILIPFKYSKRKGRKII